MYLHVSGQILFNHVFSRQTFATLQDLVTGYQSAACKGLCCQLTKPCQKPQPREGRSNALEYATRDQYEIPRSQITLTKKLGEIFFHYSKSRRPKWGFVCLFVCLFLWTPSFEGIRYPYWDLVYVRGWRRW